MINEIMKRLSELPNVTLSDGQEYIQLYDAMETVKRALEQSSGDLISRAEAIKALDEKAKRIKNEDTLNGLAGAVGILFDLPPVNPQEPKYCDRNICTKNEYNGIGCDECEVTKSQEPTDENLHREREQAYMQGYEDASKRFRQEPCTDAVSRQALLDAFGFSEKTRKYGGDHSGYNTMMLYEIQDVIEEMPSAEKTGHWKSTIDGKPICSECGFISESVDGYFVSKYCPNCGAKMVEEQERSDKKNGNK